MPIVATKHPNAFKEQAMESPSKRIVIVEMHLLLERRALSSLHMTKVLSNLSKSNTLASQIYQNQTHWSLKSINFNWMVLCIIQSHFLSHKSVLFPRIAPLLDVKWGITYSCLKKLLSWFYKERSMLELQDHYIFGEKEMWCWWACIELQDHYVFGDNNHVVFVMLMLMF